MYKKPTAVDDEAVLLDIRYLASPCSVLLPARRLFLTPRDLPETDDDDDLSIRHIRESDFFILVHSFTRRGTSELEDWLEKIREVKHIEDKILPAFVVVSSF